MSTYFEKLPFVPYPINGEFRSVRDITLNIRFKKEFIENVNVYAEYDIENNETPEIIADKLYGDSNLYWILMLFNQRYDYVEDFPLQDWVLSEYITKKYGIGKEYDQHRINGKLHYESPDGFIVDSDHPQADTISNWEYEFKLNESKRRIKIVDPNIISQITTELETIYNG
jgi:hypothetical protein